ncbi:MAG TPA: hypothetical protein VIC84_17785, partial [Blastocatellia bacterium]
MNSFQQMYLITAAFAVVLASFSNGPTTGKTSGYKSNMTSAAEGESAAKIVSLDPAFDKLVPASAGVEKLGDGHKWVEGPVWNRKDGYALFSDTINNTIFKWQDGKGESVFMQP